MRICIFEDEGYADLLPLTWTRPVFELRCGINSLLDKIIRVFHNSLVSLNCRTYLSAELQQLYPNFEVGKISGEEVLFVNGRLLMRAGYLNMIEAGHDALYKIGDEIAFAKVSGKNLDDLKLKNIDYFSKQIFNGIKNIKQIEGKLIKYPWDLVQNNAEQIFEDCKADHLLGKREGKIYPNVSLINEANISIANGAVIKPGAVLDGEGGPVVIDENTEVMSNSVLMGPCYVGKNSKVKIGAKIYPGCSFGQNCKLGGEIENTIIHSYSSKQHEGFLGHSYLGQWVNIGADTNNSNLKNNYSAIKVVINGKQVDSGSQFAGLFMGDHSKTAINTMFNSGTVVGVMCNIYGNGFPDKYIPSFIWGGTDVKQEYEFDKALDTARKVIIRRNLELSDIQKKVLAYVFEHTRNERERFLK